MTFFLMVLGALAAAVVWQAYRAYRRAFFPEYP